MTSSVHTDCDCQYALKVGCLVHTVEAFIVNLSGEFDSAQVSSRNENISEGHGE